jgi:hypothetical protein
MEEQEFVDSFDLIGMRLNNQIQEECKFYLFEINYYPLRNKIIINNSKINLDIYNEYIKNIFNKINFIKYIFNEIEIQANEINTILKINKNNFINFNEFNQVEYINEIKFKELININNKNLIILRNFHTFHQTDDNIKKHLYKILTKFFMSVDISNNFILIGGEMYIFAHIIKYKYDLNLNLNLNSYSDFQSIIDDTPDFANPMLIDYDTFILPKLNNMTIIVCNTSKSGLTNNMSEQLIKNIKYISYIVLIECSINSNKKLKFYLENNFLIEKYIKYKINYCIISLIKLNKVS